MLPRTACAMRNTHWTGVDRVHTLKPWHLPASSRRPEGPRAGRRVPADIVHDAPPVSAAARGGRPAGARRLPRRLDERDGRRQGPPRAAGPAACRRRTDDVRHRHRQHLGPGAADRPRRRGHAGRGLSRAGSSSASGPAIPSRRTPSAGSSASPLAAMRDYLERMTAPTMTPAPDAAYARIVAANGPKMTALAARHWPTGRCPPGCRRSSPRRRGRPSGRTSCSSWRCP